MGSERHWPVSQYAPCKHELHNSVYLKVSSLGHHELPWPSCGANDLRILNAGKISLSVSGYFELAGDKPEVLFTWSWHLFTVHSVCGIARF